MCCFCECSLNPPRSVDVGPQLKVISTVSVGLEHIDLKECARVQAVTDGTWGSTWDNCLYLCGQELRGATVGIVGLGRIGLGVARRLRAFSIGRLLYCGRTAKNYASDIDAEYVSFDQLLKNSDFVIVCCSVNPRNHKMFDAAAFKKMKKTAIFINTSRGILVDQKALYEALTSGEILRAGLDVTSTEPFPPDHRLLKLPNCLVLPHLGSATLRARHGMVDLAVRNTLAGLRGEPLETPVRIQ
ncbi:GRHPR-like protein [Mya arenaria]|uniref:GRHPR-like protein n=1 Tax=Mya arenaria TaxID=6604 RepID=A0ABY7EWX6_MYAAR|nr:GRHPR-like protein [Mya arenaria]